MLVVPLLPSLGGVLVRPGHTEASVDLARLAGLAPAGILCELVNKYAAVMLLPVSLLFSHDDAVPIVPQGWQYVSRSCM